MSLVFIRWAASSASGPWKSHLLRGDTSQTPTPCLMASYSRAASPKVIVQYQPPSSMKVAPMASWTSWNADLLDPPLVDSLMGGTVAERRFRNQGPSVTGGPSDACGRPGSRGRRWHQVRR